MNFSYAVGGAVAPPAPLRADLCSSKTKLRVTWHLHLGVNRRVGIHYHPDPSAPSRRLGMLDAALSRVCSRKRSVLLLQITVNQPWTTAVTIEKSKMYLIRPKICIFSTLPPLLLWFFISLSLWPIAFLFSSPASSTGGSDSLGLLMLSSPLIVHASMHHSS